MTANDPVPPLPADADHAVPAAVAAQAPCPAAVPSAAVPSAGDVGPHALAPSLADLGWDDELAAALHRLEDDALVPARVARLDRGACDCLADGHAVRARLAPGVLAAAAADPASGACTGDWVALRPTADGPALAVAVLPRRTAVLRAAVDPGTSRGQVLAANVDTVLVVEPLVPDPDLGRVERLLALAWDSGAEPVVVLTKSDLTPDAGALRRGVAAGAPGAAVLAVSATAGAGLDDVRALLSCGRTLAMLGASGAGKSSLANALAGAPVMAVSGLRADGKGRHTTAHRELVVLPGGGLLLDTPGLRSVGLPGPQGLDRAFADVEALALECRFGDCAHDGEPGCAVREAVASGVLPPRRLASWHKLRREARFQASRTDARLRQADRDRWKAITKQMRRTGSHRP